MARVFVGLGSNQGDRREHLSHALKALSAEPAIRLARVAPIVETEPAGGPPQGPYLNTVVELETRLTPLDLLSALKAIETRLGRKPEPDRWGPRPIDLDILLYEDQVIDSPSLTIPHSRMHERQFVLEPLVQIAPDLVHPILKQSISELLKALNSPIAQ